jgi:hypothetical protein
MGAAGDEFLQIEVLTLRSIPPSLHRTFVLFR